jgi:O-antigen ligase
VRHSDIKVPFRPGTWLFWMLLALASIALGGLATSQSPKASVVAAALLAAMTVTTIKALRALTMPQLYVMVASVAGGLVGLPTAIHIGSYTGEAALTVAMAYAGLMLLITVDRSELAGLPRSVTILFAFCVWGGLSFAWTSPTVAGIQNLLVYVMFVSTIALAYVATQTDAHARRLIGRSITAASALSYILYGTTLAIAGPGGSGVIASRSFGLFALIAVSWFATGWRYEMPYCRALTFVGILLATLSLSRTAAVCCVLIAVVARIRVQHLGGALRALLGVSAALILISLAIRYVPPIHERFFTGDVRNVGGVTLNVEGRTKFWETTWRSYETSPVYGHGIGSADVLISRTYGAAAAHPHNDYLRLANDLGIIGVALWIAGFAGLILSTGRLWSHANLGSATDKRFSATACIGLLAVAVAMGTDNVMTYLFVMAPLGVVTGAALGSARAARSRSHLSRSRSAPVEAQLLS